MHGRECREVSFSDGTRVTCDADHLWSVYTPDDRRRGRSRVVRTKDMELDLRRGHDYRYRTVQAAPVEYPERDLPVDPYVLGVWIGDGTSMAAEVTCADEPIVRELELAGYGGRRATGPLSYRVGGAGDTRDPATGRYCMNASLSSALRGMVLLGAKRIPTEYLQASVEQRRALLDGLMDTDGDVDTLGRGALTARKRGLGEAD